MHVFLSKSISIENKISNGNLIPVFDKETPLALQTCTLTCHPLGCDGAIIPVGTCSYPYIFIWIPLDLANFILTTSSISQKIMLGFIMICYISAVSAP